MKQLGMDDQTLKFPAHIAKQIGLSANEISWLRKLGCPFHGRKTSVRWVRLYLDRTSGAESLIRGTEFAQCPLAKALARRGSCREHFSKWTNWSGQGHVRSLLTNSLEQNALCTTGKCMNLIAAWPRFMRPDGRG
jgi:hypothetical protein